MLTWLCRVLRSASASRFCQSEPSSLYSISTCSFEFLDLAMSGFLPHSILCSRYLTKLLAFLDHLFEWVRVFWRAGGSRSCGLWLVCRRCWSTAWGCWNGNAVLQIILVAAMLTAELSQLSAAFFLLRFLTLENRVAKNSTLRLSLQSVFSLVDY